MWFCPYCEYLCEDVEDSMFPTCPECGEEVIWSGEVLIFDTLEEKYL